MVDLLIEIGTEEIPASYTEPALRALAEGLVKACASSRLSLPEPTRLGTPRRLTLHFAGVPAESLSVTEERMGPAARIAFDADGNPTKAGLGFARSQGLDPSELQVVTTPKGPYVGITVKKEGEAAGEVVARSLPGAIAAVPFPKSMRWSGSDVAFARPIRGLTVLLGSEVLPVAVAGVVAGRTVSGHPFLAPESVDLPDADLAGYVRTLEESKVLVDPDVRRESIRDQLVKRLGEGRALSEELLAEVTWLTEWPRVLEGRIEEDFLALPVEVLEVAMRVHLRFFPVLSEHGRPEPRFLSVMNRRSASSDIVREGNERVLRSRLQDARFFLSEDSRRPLADRVEELSDKALHKHLGSYGDKAARLVALSAWLAKAAGWDDVREQAERGALLAKADLVTEMVGEFPELQGTVGRIYALRDGEDPDVAEAVEDHYRPRGPGDSLPRGRVACVVSLAEKIDNLVAFFSVVGAPTGSSDPFGLRRQALGLLRIAVDRKTVFPLRAAIEKAIAILGAGEPDALATSVLGYLGDRLYQASLDEGFRYDLVRACLAAGFDDLLDFHRRLQALRELAEEESWPRLVEVVERARNITKGADSGGEVVEAVLVEPEEKALWASLCEHAAPIRAQLNAGKYVEAARAFVDAFGEVVHEFFAKVYVNADDPAVRANRLALLTRLNGLFAEPVADLSDVSREAEQLIDIHSHYLFDVDDGARTLEDSVEMLRVAAADGTTVMVATPHQRHPAGYHVPRELAESRLEEVRAAVAREGIGIELALAAEIHFSEEIPAGIEAGTLMPLCPDGRYFLFELPVTTIPGNILEVVFSFQTAGHYPVLAHPERNFEVMERPEIARDLRDRGVLLQLTASSITGRFGRKSEKAAKKLLKWGVVDVIASDAHNPGRRPPGLSKAVKVASKVLGRENAELLVTEIPGRIIRGESVY